MCKNDEVCFIQKYSANGNDFRYDVGCSYLELCRKDLTGHVLGRRSDHSHVICHKCCNNSDTCNVRLSCNDKINVHKQKCLSCSEITDPRMCKNITTCARDEVCYLHKYTTYAKQQRYDLGCKTSALCTHGYLNILGRRSSFGVHQECESCCSGTALCNHDLQCNRHSQKTINSSCSSINECIGNLICLSGICQCPSDEYYWNVDTCIEKNTHDSSCVSSDECIGTLLCIHGQCKCDRTDYWSGSLCVPKKSFNSTCITNEQCNNKYRCIDNICRCTQSEILNGTQCLSNKNFNSTCNINEHCRYPLQCISNVCTCIQAEYWNGIQCLSKKLECQDIEDTKDGVYTIYPGGGDTAVDVYCIMGDTNTCKWFCRFYRTWQEYKDGFGSVYGEYWLGNDYIHMISTNGHHELSIYMQAGSDHRMANYSTFSVGDERSKYRLTVTGYSGDAGADSMDKVDDNVKANGQPFTTKDRDNDNHVGNCAVKSKSAWWFRNCFFSDFNRAYSGSSGKMYWAWFSGNIRKSILMIRRTS